MAKAFSPTGVIIVATADVVEANALVREESFSRLPDGSLDCDFVGETEVCWDSQRTKDRAGKELYVDADGEEWTSDEIVLVGELPSPALAFWLQS